MIHYQNSYKDVLRIAAPISFSLTIPQISFVANTIFVAKLGNLPLVILGLVSIYYLLLTWMSYGLNNGLLILMSRRAGAKDEIGFSSYITNGIIAGLLMMLILFVGSWWIVPLYYQYSYEDSAVIKGGVDFFNIRIWGFPFMLFSQMGNSILISLGKAKWLVLCSVIANAALIFFDYGMIFGNLGFSKMGVMGAAWASTISEIIYFTVIIFILIYKIKIIEKIRFKSLVSKTILKNIISVSAPLIFQYIFSIGGWLFFFTYMEHMGREEVAASHILRNYMGIVGIGAWALASTSNTMVSNLIGQDKSKEIMSVLKKLTIVGLSFALIIVSISMLGSDFLIGAFTKDIMVVSLIHEGLWVLWLNTFIMICGTIAFNGLMGMGNTKQNMIIEVSGVILYVMYLSFIMDYLDLGFFWAWTSEWIYWSILVVWSWIIIKRMKIIKFHL